MMYLPTAEREQESIEHLEFIFMPKFNVLRIKGAFSKLLHEGVDGFEIKHLSVSLFDT